MNFPVKLMFATIAAFLGIAWSWIFRSRKVQSRRDVRIEIGQSSSAPHR